MLEVATPAIKYHYRIIHDETPTVLITGKLSRLDDGRLKKSNS